MTGAQALIESLKREHVEHMFGYAGATICAAVDALANAPEIGYTLVRTEQNAGHMASGYYRVTGKVGVCMVTSGPGATNLITGIATAYLDSIPMVAITGQVPSKLLGRDIFQEVDITGAVAPFSKHSYLVKNANDIPRVVKAAAAAKQPVICGGGGVFLAGARRELRELAERTNIPVVTTMMGLSLLPTSHPLNMGMIGAHGNVCANKALAKADLLIMVGCRAADRAILSPTEIQRRMPTIHIDVDPAEIGKNMRTAIPLVGDVKVILKQILLMDPQRQPHQWLGTLQQMRREELSRTFPHKDGYVFPGLVLRKLGARLRPDAAVCVDVGQNQIWACKHLPLNGLRFLTSGGLGTMGYSLPCAVGVKVAQPGRQTIVICGDGSFQMSFNELAAVQAGHMDIKIVLFQNDYLGLVRQIQCTPAYPAGPFGVALDGSPDFAAIAAAYGIPSRVVDDEAVLDEAIDEMLRSESSYLLICKVDPQASTND